MQLFYLIEFLFVHVSDKNKLGGGRIPSLEVPYPIFQNKNLDNTRCSN